MQVQVTVHQSFFNVGKITLNSCMSIVVGSTRLEEEKGVREYRYTTTCISIPLNGWRTANNDELMVRREMISLKVVLRIKLLDYYCIIISSR